MEMTAQVTLKTNLFYCFVCYSVHTASNTATTRHPDTHFYSPYLTWVWLDLLQYRFCVNSHLVYIFIAPFVASERKHLSLCDYYGGIIINFVADLVLMVIQIVSNNGNQYSDWISHHKWISWKWRYPNSTRRLQHEMMNMSVNECGMILMWSI
jgi:hypothetical protein